MSKVLVLTGSTDGIGKLAATKFAQEGHTVYLHGRNSDKLSTLDQLVFLFVHIQAVMHGWT